MKTREELEAMGYQEVKAYAEEIGISYTTKQETIDEILVKTDPLIVAVFVKNYRRFRKNNAYKISTIEYNQFKKIGVVK